jgi:hypothetical protein
VLLFFSGNNLPFKTIQRDNSAKRLVLNFIYWLEDLSEVFEFVIIGINIDMNYHIRTDGVVMSLIVCHTKMNLIA